MRRGSVFPCAPVSTFSLSVWFPGFEWSLMFSVANSSSRVSILLIFVSANDMGWKCSSMHSVDCPEHDKALDNLKAVLTIKPALAFYDVTKPVTIQADASQSGLGACILQKGKPVAYASRAMTQAEQNYAQIEKEMSEICFATSKFHQYVYGKSAVSVQTDHKPLESILKKPLCKAPPILQRLMLRLHPYDLDVHYVPGKYKYLADTLSRACIPGEGNAEMEEELSRVVHTLVLNIPVSANKLSEICQATEQDPMLTKVRNLIMTG